MAHKIIEAIIELADNDSLDILQSRVGEQKTSSSEGNKKFGGTFLEIRRLYNG